jgi:Flp pilus assembly protein TadG
MTCLKLLWRDQRAAAAVEMALVFPLLLIIGMGGVEVGNYFLDQHRLVKAVRDGARYAARQDFSNYVGCNGTPADVPTALRDNVKSVVRTGLLSSGTDLLANWNNATFTVKMTCTSTVGTQTLGGIYTGTSGGQPPAVVIVTATVPYAPIAVSGFGFNARGYNLYGQQQAAVMGV